MIDEELLLTFSTRDALAFWSREKIRYQDLDTNGHVNNIAYLAYVECARLEFRRSILDSLPDADYGAWVIASSAIRFLKPSFYPGDIDVGTVPVQVGRTSFTLGYGLFRGTDCVAVAGSRSVQVDAASNKPVPLPDAFREALETLLR